MEFPIEKVAELSYLELSEDEKKEFQDNFKEILSYVDHIQSVEIPPNEAAKLGSFHVQTAFYQRLGLSSLQTLRQPAEHRSETENSEFESLKLTNETTVKNAPATSGLPGELLFEVPSILSK